VERRTDVPRTRSQVHKRELAVGAWGRRPEIRDIGQVAFRNRSEKNGRIARRLAAATVAVGLVTGLVAALPATQATAASIHGAVDTVLVRFKPTVNDAAATAAEHAAGASHIGDVADIGVRILQVPSGAAATVASHLATRHDVEFAESDQIATVSTTTPNDYYWPAENSPVKVNAPTAWDTTTGSSAVTVAVLDTGLTTGPDLQGNVLSGWNFVAGTSNTADDNGHGTQAAGVIGAQSNNSIGVTSFCWQCSLLQVKVMGADGTGSMSNVASGITWAADHGARVISLSLGGAATSTVQSAVSYAQSKGAVVVAAAGNSSSSTAQYPAAYSGVLSVGAVDASDQLATYSNYGSWVQVAAPGTNWTTTRSGTYGTFAGTSSETPVVAGIAGLLASASPTSSGTAIVSAIEHSAAPVGSFVNYGRVDAAAAVANLTGGGTPPPPPSGTPPANTAAPVVSGTAQSGQTLTASAGSWSGTTPMTYAFQWQHCDSSGASCTAVAGATAQTYALTSADVGFTMRAAVTASNAYGAATISSAATAVVAAPPPPPPPPPATTTSTFSGSLNRKQTSQSFGVTVGAGSANASLSFTKASSLVLTVKAADGSTVGSASGPSVLSLVSNLAAGNYTYVVSNSTSASFTLTVTYQTP